MFISIFEILICNFIEKIKFNTEVLKYLELDPLVAELKSFLTPKIYMKQLFFYSLSKKYESKIVSKEEGRTVYEVIYNKPSVFEDDEYEPTQYSPYSVSIGKYINCSCKLFTRLGLVCAYIFHICRIRNVKSISS